MSLVRIQSGALFKSATNQALVLFSLTEEELDVSSIIKRSLDKFGQSLSPNSIYQIIKDLNRKKLIEVRREIRRNGGKPKVFCTLTENGRNQIKESKKLFLNFLFQI